MSYSRICSVVTNGGIRWKADLDMIERALQLKDALQLYQDHYTSENTDRLNTDNCLTAEDWYELSELKQPLEPLKYALKRCQATPVDSHNDAL